MADYLEVAVFTRAGSKDLREEEARMCACTNVGCSYYTWSQSKCFLGYQFSFLHN